MDELGHTYDFHKAWKRIGVSFILAFVNAPDKSDFLGILMPRGSLRSHATGAEEVKLLD